MWYWCCVMTAVSRVGQPWKEMTELLKERYSKLEEAGDLHRFLRDLDHFSAWLTKTQTDVASEDIPQSLSEAERLLSRQYRPPRRAAHLMGRGTGQTQLLGSYCGWVGSGLV